MTIQINYRGQLAIAAKISTQEINPRPGTMISDLIRAAAARHGEGFSKLTLAADEATATEDLAWERYRNGTGDFLSALDAQRTADAARSRQLGVANLLLQNRIDLYLALGGPFRSDLLQPPPASPANHIHTKAH